MLDRPIIVYMSGNNASGKTTLGQALASRLNWLHLPEDRFDQSYLDDLFSAERRWSFEAQLHFLTHKVGCIKTAIVRERNAIIDRSPYEDAEVFAEHFYSAGKMDERAIKTYREAFRHFSASLPDPDLFIYCFTPQNVLEQRVKDRDRNYEERYPVDHLAELARRYDQWLIDATKRFPKKIVRIDTSKVDFRTDNEAIGQVAEETLKHLLNIWLSQQGAAGRQLILFNSEFGSKPLHESLAPRGIRPYIEIAPTLTPDDCFRFLLSYQPSPAAIKRRDAARKRKRLAYIAAPFTTKAGLHIDRKSQASGLPGVDVKREPEHGILDDQYISWLLYVESLVSSAGFSTILPHRDVNKWGHRLLKPANAIVECTRQVIASDVLIAFPDRSFGVHYEVGIAVGANIPVIIVAPDAESLTFILQGGASLSKMNLLVCRDEEELRLKLPEALSKIEKR